MLWFLDNCVSQEKLNQKMTIAESFMSMLIAVIGKRIFTTANNGPVVSALIFALLVVKTWFYVLFLLATQALAQETQADSVVVGRY